MKGWINLYFYLILSGGLLSIHLMVILVISEV